MTNLEFYKTPKAISKAYAENCKKQEFCKNCKYQEFCKNCKYCEGDGQIGCLIGFMLDQHEAPKKRRGYTFEEAEKLLGATIRYVDEQGNRHSEKVYNVCERESFVCINFESPGYFFKINATVDGNPYGVEVQE